MVVDERYMKRCLELAGRAAGYTSPNPLVGAVIVHNGKIIGEGFHRKAGEAHAEVNAIASVVREELLRESTLYVNLEPCSHYGKTPPCAELIIDKRIPRVVVGCLDPFPEVSGRGVRRLQQAGVKVVTGVMREEAHALNKVFMTFNEQKRPYIYLKWAQSMDGYMDRVRTDATVPPVTFSSPETRRKVHKLRSEVAAILVGTQTALLDNPSLSVRHWRGNNPVRVVLDRYLRIPSHYHLLDGRAPTIVFTARERQNQPNLEYIVWDDAQPVLPQVLQALSCRKLDSLLVEGGAFLLQSFLQEGLWDEARVETAPCLLGEGVKAPVIPSIAVQTVARTSVGSSSKEYLIDTFYKKNLQ
ncbi:bifunctional diaminohydroxyphosphoribosylaminopyrimidine deaminase/5-amino-6-(5-phosphoribosylamino)uracil reductase RibD [Parabacteroides sp. 52]|uniref:bifunctional diaminohydroxyphosphoribosylaminopyrimidine deaminase/5-amino-6-(5-phosphoribosylamino)uracil reductase RibD n=1 Tax=unclassified Parabacteroides TaxID=2649774 RepID=UPI0013D5D423|nr:MULTISPECIES: bifunctional diaminohydroxyphosphoribosylaminopyrimidine deaminase/5-amino-6-(5-phosphoribosylamino)uracil reductase RibD [unclassified Parabacteroides]MDH6534128.1 diaminohydroxyphosphoribosylaminopyrimidine deaminase/5-amino-6-(5-phosphoribosylamino)uracil reductase [Parabacteroides sp. PM5-20]NDV54969.1 bifunctional diaminohydroxyphosphoribosylaminopyrimidine deaminase/5-amino-6-(5-phosphoribosylamino)uracil reductase RibD [Parabacteroides sp. 52]